MENKKRKSGLYWLTLYPNIMRICYWCSVDKKWYREGSEIVGIKEIDEKEVDLTGTYKKI